MGLILTKSCFLHIPKTGGSSVRLSLQSAGANVSKECETGHANMPFNRRAHMPLHEAKEWHAGPFFTFVRHPVSWYASYYAHRVSAPWTLPQQTLERFAWRNWNHSFSDWVHGITAAPNFAGGYFQRYIGPEVMVGRVEFLEHDLFRFLDQLEEPYKDITVMQTNVSKIKVDITEEDRRMILSAERWLLEHFYQGQLEPAISE